MIIGERESTENAPTEINTIQAYREAQAQIIVTLKVYDRDGD